MKNKLTDLNNHLFSQIERLSEEDLSGDKLTAEIGRARAVTEVAQQIISNANLSLKAQSLMYEYGIIKTNSEFEKKMPAQLKDFFLQE